MPQRQIAAAVLDVAGRTFCEELAIPIERNTPSALFRTLCFALLASTRIGHRIALEAARGLTAAGWTTPRKMADATWQQRVDVLDHAGYVRYDESTSTMLAQTSELLLERYRGDLRRLRDAAGRDPGVERERLKEFKGVGDVGADIFFREVQLVWKELFPFADQRALEAARRLGLPGDAARLRALVGDEHDQVRLVTGLVRVELEDAYPQVREAI